VAASDSKRLRSTVKFWHSAPGHLLPVGYGLVFFPWGLEMSKRIMAMVASAVVIGWTGLAAAQEAQRGVSVADRERPDYDPIGIRAGGFIIYPAITGSVGFTDNLFKQDTNEQDDFFFAVTPEVAVESQWSRHALNLNAALTTLTHDENESDDVTDYSFGADGRLDVTRDSFATANAGYRLYHEDRGSPDLPAQAAEPTEIEEFAAGLTYTHRFNRLSLRPSFSYLDRDYDDSGLIGGGQINNDDRDRDIKVYGMRVGYEVSPAFEVFGEGRYNEVEYDNPDDVLGGGTAFRDSDGYDALVGTSFDLGAVARGEIAVGYTEQDYDSNLLQTVDGFVYEGGVEWFVTEMTTVNIGGARGVEETTLAGSSGYLSTSVSVGVDHELRRNVLIGGDVFYSNSDYEGIDRDDDVYGAGVDATYLLNRNFSLALEYDFETRESDAANSDYNQNTVLLSLRAAL